MKGLKGKSAKIVFLGLDNGGKTTLLGMMRDDRMLQASPTHHPSKFCCVVYSLHEHAVEGGTVV